MIFTTQCPSCEATFPIDSAKVPDGGVYARCSECSGVFLVEVPAPQVVEETQAVESPQTADHASAEATAPSAAVDESLVDEPVVEEAAERAPDEPAVEAATTVTADAEDWTTDAEAEDTETAAEPAAAFDETPETPEAPALPEAPAARDAPEVAAPAATATTAPPVFGKRDPHERAQRLARVLVSDMIAYHPDRHRRSLEEGSLKGDFEEEIDKSWNEYVDQVGQELADSTAYFTEALNEILAKGESVF